MQTGPPPTIIEVSIKPGLLLLLQSHPIISFAAYYPHSLNIHKLPYTRTTLFHQTKKTPHSMLAQTIITFLALALAVSASPLAPRQIASSGNDGEGNQDVGNKGQNAGNSAANKGTVKGDYTVEQGVQTCGNAQLNCCNKIEKKGDTTNAGLLGALFGSGDIGLQCTPLNIPVVGGKCSCIHDSVAPKR